MFKKTNKTQQDKNLNNWFYLFLWTSNFLADLSHYRIYSSKVSLVVVVTFSVGVLVCVLLGVWQNMGDLYYVPWQSNQQYMHHFTQTTLLGRGEPILTYFSFQQFFFLINIFADNLKTALTQYLNLQLFSYWHMLI